MASHVALEEAGAEFELRQINIFAGEHLTPEYLVINPRARVPALQIDDGTVIVENVAILSWIARSYPAARLMGESVLDQARCISLAAWLASTVHTAFGRVVRPERFADDEASQAAVQAKAKAAYWDGLQEIDRLLEGRDWLVGDGFTVCDPYALVFYGWAPELSLPVETLGNYTALKDRVLARPAARRALEREQSALLSM